MHYNSCDTHLEKCLFVEVLCTKKCGEILLRKECQNHEDNKCPNRLVQCQYCNTMGMHKEITAKHHLDECPRFPTSCPNNCGHEKVQRKNLVGHESKCPLEPVKCPFFDAGCKEVILRKDLEAHKAWSTDHHLELVMTETVKLKQKANKLEQENTQHQLQAKSTKDQLQQLALKFDCLASCVTKQLGTIDSEPRNTPKAIKNIKSSLETITTMLAPGDTRYYLPLVKESQYFARSVSFYIKPGYKMHAHYNLMNLNTRLEKGEHDHKLEWPMPEMEIVLSTSENKTLNRVTICTKCGYTVNRLEEDKTEQDMDPWSITVSLEGDQKDFLFLTVRKHICRQFRVL